MDHFICICKGIATGENLLVCPFWCTLGNTYAFQRQKGDESGKLAKTNSIHSFAVHDLQDNLNSESVMKKDLSVAMLLVCVID